MDKSEFYSLYRASYNNAFDLLEESKILYKYKKYARSYFIACTGMEEASKSQLAADVFTGKINKKEFYKHYKNHSSKLKNVTWITNDMKDGVFDSHTGEYMHLEFPSLRKRTDGLYVDVASSPKTITKENANGLINLLQLMLSKIWEIDFLGGPLGTKHFEK